MASLYSEKARLDDLAARQLNYTDSYESRLYRLYLTPAQVDDMNTVFKERKGIFEDYNRFKRKKLGLETLKPYDLLLQLTDQSGKNYTYIDALQEIQKSYSKMDPRFNEIFLKTVTGNFIDVYPDPEHGKQPGGYCYRPLCHEGSGLSLSQLQWPYRATRKPSLMNLGMGLIST